MKLEDKVKNKVEYIRFDFYISYWMFFYTNGNLKYLLGTDYL